MTADAMTTGPTPAPPISLAQTGLPPGVVADLLRKHLFVSGPRPAAELADAVALPLAAVGGLLRHLAEEGSIDLRQRTGSGDRLADAAVSLSATGRRETQTLFRTSRYVGPAPVPVEQFLHRAAAQHPSVSRPALVDDWAGQVSALVGDASEPLQIAAADARGLVLIGADGCGKRAIARRLAEQVCRCLGPVWLPSAILAGDRIMTVFDPTRHQPVRTAGVADARWRCVLRPVVEATAADLQPRPVPAGSTPSVPDVVKGCGGVCLANADELPPERLRQLAIATDPPDRPTRLPVASMLIVTASQWPADAAVLRRLRHKVAVPPPSESSFAMLLQAACRDRSIPLDPAAGPVLWQTHFAADRPHRPSAADAEELVEIAASICRFREQPPAIGPTVLLDAARRYLPAA